MNNGTAIVTGSSRGIGKAIALKLAANGFNVVVNYRQNQQQAEEVLAEIEAMGAKGIIVGADVSNPEDAKLLVDKAVSSFGGVQVLVNNAGISKDQLLVRISDDDWDHMLKTNLYSAFYCTRAVLKSMMKNRYGRIINISSVVGLSGNPGQAHYAAAKAGLIGFTGSVAREYGARGITANVVAPGYIETDMTAGLANTNGGLVERVAVGRAGIPEDVAAMVAFLASFEAGYISGQVMRVDGYMAL
ncbi:MAG: 3-oxoacyl-[acyl-carrier-protein] reductase [Chitinophagales bacterium]